MTDHLPSPRRSRVTWHAPGSLSLSSTSIERAPLAKIVDRAVSPAPSVGHILMAPDRRALLDAIQPVSRSHRLRILVTRDERNLAGSELALQRVPGFWRDLETRVHALVISAPSLPADETRALLGVADAVIGVVVVGHTRGDQVTSMRRAFADANVTRFGYVAIEPRPAVGFRQR